MSNDPLRYVDPSGHAQIVGDSPYDTAPQQKVDIVVGEMHASDELAEFLKTYEKLHTEWYYATPGEKKKDIKTIGYGHVIRPGEKSLLKGITEDKALALLKLDIQNKAENYVNAWAKKKDVVFTQQQFDALVSWKFNGGDFLNHDPGEMLESGDFSSSEFKNKFSKEMLLWVKGGDIKLKGLYLRRYDEWEMFSCGDYTRNENRVIPSDF